MHPQSTEDQYRVTFNHTGVEPVTAPADATIDDLAGIIRRAFLAAEVIDVDDLSLSIVIDGDDGAIMITSGELAIVADGVEIEHGFITRVPDYWLTLADAVRQHADRIATLAGTDWKPTYAGLSVSMADPGNKNPIAGDMVDVVAGAFGLTAKTVKGSGGYYERKASGGPLDGLRFNVYGYVPEPADPEKAALAARVAELEAQLAEGGATR